MIKKLKKLFACALIAVFSLVGFTQSVHATMIGTDQVLSAQAARHNQERIAAALERPDVIAQLEQFGVSKSDAQSRVAALTDAEAATLAHQIDSLPAGGASVLGTLLFVFVLLLVTDLLGLTRIFPFTRTN
jgi:hypothetical protein